MTDAEGRLIDLVLDRFSVVLRKRQSYWLFEAELEQLAQQIDIERGRERLERSADRAADRERWQHPRPWWGGGL